MTKERNQNPTIGDDLKLRLFVYKSNCRADVCVEKVEIFFNGETSCCEDPSRRLIQTITAGNVTHECLGEYSVTFPLTDLYSIGKYEDVWTLKLDQTAPCASMTNLFQIMPSLWYTSPNPIVYDFQFVVRPNRIRKGSKQYLIVDIEPNVPRASDLESYYRNLSSFSCVSISMEQNCLACPSPDGDLVIDDQPIIYRDRGRGYYFLDTTDIDCGIYNIWFKMNFGENVYISDKQQIQIYN